MKSNPMKYNHLIRYIDAEHDKLPPGDTVTTDPDRVTCPACKALIQEIIKKYKRDQV